MRRAIAFMLGGLVLLGGTAPSAWAAPNDPGWDQQWNLARIRADKAWATSKGKGVVVAIIDTGVDLGHPDLQGRLVSGIDLVDGGSPQDDNGHGTFMAGIVAARTGNGEGVASVAPSAKILPVKVLKSDGTGDPETVADGIRWAVDEGHADVINLSLAETADGGIRLGSDFFANSHLENAIEYAAGHGRFVSIAAGNDFTNGGTTQTAYTDDLAATLVVGASTSGDKRAAYSNYGGGLDVLAPGGGSSSAPDAPCKDNDPVVSAWWDPKTQTSGYGAGCGTSMAVAHVSGLAALLRARGYSSSAAAQRIVSTARNIGSGYLRIDALAAVRSSSAAPPATAPKPSAKKTAPKKKVTAAASPTNAPPLKVTPTPSDTGLLLAADDASGSQPAPRGTLVMIATALALLVGVAHPFVRVALFPR